MSSKDPDTRENVLSDDAIDVKIKSRNTNVWGQKSEKGAFGSGQVPRFHLGVVTWPAHL